MIKKCLNCNEEKEHQAKGLCYKCYINTYWKPKIAKKIACKRCKNTRIIHTKGLCASCYNFVFHINRIKGLNYQKSFNLSLDQYKTRTKQCILCDFAKIVELHHLDEDKSNNIPKNLVPLCPNHHKMVHNFEFRQEIRELLEKKGYFLKKDPKLDYFHKTETSKSES